MSADAFLDTNILIYATQDAALALGETDNFSVYDALIVAAALQTGCTILWSEDMQNGRRVADRLTIRNPFVPQPIGPYPLL